MKVLAISSQNNKNTKFKGLVFHENSKQLITQGNNGISKQISEISEKLQKSHFDLHVKPDSKQNVSFYWTKHKSQTPIMEAQTAPYTRLTLNQNTSAKTAVDYISSEQAEQAYNMLRTRNQTPIQKLDTAANITLKLDKK